MPLTQRLRLAAQQPQEALKCIDMHVTSEPTRILYKGFPELSGTLLEQSAQARNEHDNVRRRLMLELWGHRDMYGAILCRNTERVRSGEAHIGVLFATTTVTRLCTDTQLALGHFLIDTYYHDISPSGIDLR